MYDDSILASGNDACTANVEKTMFLLAKPSVCFYPAGWLWSVVASSVIVNYHSQKQTLWLVDLEVQHGDS